MGNCGSYTTRSGVRGRRNSNTQCSDPQQRVCHTQVAHDSGERQFSQLSVLEHGRAVIEWVLGRLHEEAA
jgi:hypothetical protein